MIYKPTKVFHVRQFKAGLIASTFSIHVKNYLFERMNEWDQEQKSCERHQGCGCRYTGKILLKCNKKKKIAVDQSCFCKVGVNLG